MKLHADFNGLFGDILCLSHEDEQGRPDNLIAAGVVEASPEWLSCRGSKWVLRIDEHGVRHESDIARS